MNPASPDDRQLTDRAQDLHREGTQNLSLLLTPELTKDSGDALALGVSNGAQSIARHGAETHAGEVGDDEANTAPADGTDIGPPRYSLLNLRTQELGMCQS